MIDHQADVEVSSNDSDLSRLNPVSSSSQNSASILCSQSFARPNRVLIPIDGDLPLNVSSKSTFTHTGIILSDGNIFSYKPSGNPDSPYPTHDPYFLEGESQYEVSSYSRSYTHSHQPSNDTRNVFYDHDTEESEHSSNLLNLVPCSSNIIKQQSRNSRQSTVGCSSSSFNNSPCELEENRNIGSIGNDFTHHCDQCGEVFDSDNGLLKHKNCCHRNEVKRNVLCLEQKVEIIQRVNSGEKKSALTEEYGVNMSTIKNIMKKSDTYLRCWKNGLFTPSAKSIRPAKREDVEQALYLWYKYAQENDLAISGPILCSKAVDFASKLGYADFKPSHGWLDRFKKRKKISLSRRSSKQRCDDETNHCLPPTVLPQLLADYDSSNVFALDFCGLFFHTLPAEIMALKDDSCPGGIKAKLRLSAIICTNMTGNEKLPILVAGAAESSLVVRAIQNSTIHYVQEDNAWLTPEILFPWLQDLDSWFVRQGRKVIFVAPASPILRNPLIFRAIKLVVMPSSFPLPLRQFIFPIFKTFYRKTFLDEFLSKSEEIEVNDNYENLRIPLSKCLCIMNSSWQAVPQDLIASSFQRSGITKFGVWNMVTSANFCINKSAMNESFVEVCNRLNVDLSSYEITADDYIHVDDNLQVCNLMRDDDILATVAQRVKMEQSDIQEGSNLEDSSDASLECDGAHEQSLEIPLLSEVESALSVLRNYIQYKENAQEMFAVLANFEHFVYKKNHSTKLPE